MGLRGGFPAVWEFLLEEQLSYFKGGSDVLQLMLQLGFSIVAFVLKRIYLMSETALFSS